MYCTLQERLTNRGAPTQGLTNRTTEGEGRGIKRAQSGIRSVLSAEKCFEMSLTTHLLLSAQQSWIYKQNVLTFHMVEDRDQI